MCHNPLSWWAASTSTLCIFLSDSEGIVGQRGGSLGADSTLWAVCGLAGMEACCVRSDKRVACDGTDKGGGCRTNASSGAKNGGWRLARGSWDGEVHSGASVSIVPASLPSRDGKLFGCCLLEGDGVRFSVVGEPGTVLLSLARSMHTRV